MLYRVSRAMVEFHGPWAYDSEKYLILNFALGGTFPFKTNGVRHPYRGLSAETVASARAPAVGHSAVSAAVSAVALAVAVAEVVSAPADRESP